MSDGVLEPMLPRQQRSVGLFDEPLGGLVRRSFGLNCCVLTALRCHCLQHHNYSLK